MGGKRWYSFYSSLTHYGLHTIIEYGGIILVAFCKTREGLKFLKSLGDTYLNIYPYLKIQISARNDNEGNKCWYLSTSMLCSWYPINPPINRSDDQYRWQ